MFLINMKATKTFFIDTFTSNANFDSSFSLQILKLYFF